MDNGNDQSSGSLVGWTQAIYALHAFSLLTGIIGAATVVGAFLTGWPSIIAVIINYVKRDEVRGTYLETHFRWQLRTFWYALLWIGVTLLIGAPLTLILIGVYIVIMGFAIVGLWVAYRLVRGWLKLREQRPMPAMASGPSAGA